MSLAADRRVRRAASFARAIAQIYRDRDVPFMAGSIAYAAFVSLIPAVLLLFVAASILGGETLRTYVLDLTTQYLSPTSQGLLAESIAQATEQLQLSILAVTALLWAVYRIFRTLDAAFSELYGVERQSPLRDRITDWFVVGAAMLIAVLTMVVVGMAITAASSLAAGVVRPLPLVELLTLGTLVGGLFLAFVPIYYVFPDVPVTVREVLPGALVAAVGWTVLQALFHLYVSITSTTRLYGVVGGVIIVVTWLYFGAVILLLGGATNVVLGGWDRPAQHVDE